MRKSFPGGSVGRESACNAGDARGVGFDTWVGKIPWRREWQATPVFLPGPSHGQRSLEGYSPQGCKESDKTEVTEHASTQSKMKFKGAKWLTEQLKKVTGAGVETREMFLEPRD